MMQFSLAPAELEAYTLKLMDRHLPDGLVSRRDMGSSFGHALERVEHCFSRIQRKYYNEHGSVRFDHLNSDHMAAYLYLLANTIWRETQDDALPVRLFYLNKIMHGLDLFYSVQLPAVFLLVHPVGTVLGNARYGEEFVVYQNCTVGADGTAYPSFGTGTILYARSAVIGRCQLGDDVVLAANSQIVNTDVPANTVVTGQYPQHRFSENRTSVHARCFGPSGVGEQGGRND